jgi:catechol 2,3-dioxygenase-like lactoylglutathione lyase family enzyme
MSTLVATTPVKFHISLNVSDLNKSIAFYKLLFGTDPAKCRPDYAKFESDNPPLVLSLEPLARTPGGSLNHLGLRVGDSEALVAIQRRFEAAGIATQREEGVECCYALQTKFWVTDPDRNLWELYILHEDLEHRGPGQSMEQMLPPGTTPAVTWEHTLGMEFTATVPQADQSVDEVRLLGSFNAAAAKEMGATLLQEVWRVLRPGGRLMVHTLVGDCEMKTRPKLPGPAAAVEAVPVESDLLKGLESAGFVSLELEKYASRPCFTVDGVRMREMKLWAAKPHASSAQPARFVLYKGPLRQVTDDAGNIFPRGQRVALDSQAWATLQQSSAAQQFVFFADESLVTLNCGS